VVPQGGTITPSSITLRPGKTGTTWPGVEDGPNCSQEILLGKPIIQIRHEDIFNESSTRRISDVLRAWVALDRINIVRRQAGLYFVEGPPAYQTGEPPQQLATASYWNPQNLEICTKNLTLAATSLWNVLRHPQISMKADVNQSPWIEGSKALRDLLRWCEVMEPKLRGFVRGLEDEP
jgi:hypothetical protein